MSDNGNPNGIPTEDMPDNPKIRELIEKYEVMSLDDGVDAQSETNITADALSRCAQEEPAADDDARASRREDVRSTDPDMLSEVDRLLKECGIVLDDTAATPSSSALPPTDPATAKPAENTQESTPDAQPTQKENDLASPPVETIPPDSKPELAAGMRVIYDADDHAATVSSGRYPPVERFTIPEKMTPEPGDARNKLDPVLTGMRIVYESDTPAQNPPREPVSPPREDSSSLAETPSGIADLMSDAAQIEDSPAVKKKSRGGFLPRKGDSVGEKIRKSVLILSVLTMLICGGFLLETYVVSPYLSNRRAQETIQLRINSSTETDWSQIKDKYADIDFPEGMQLKYAALYVQNPDFIGWLDIPGTGIDMPVVQGADNKEYLKKTFAGEKSKYGCAFVDSANNIETLDLNTIIYGHNMSYDDLMFGKLENYRTPEGYHAAPIIEFNTLFADYRWKIYAVFLSNGQNQQDNGYVFNYIFKNLSTDEVFSSYIRELDSRKFYITGVDIEPTDTLLTLSTCAYDFDGARLVVVARMVRPGESAEIDFENVTENPNPRYPQAWYDRKRRSNPFADAARWFPS